MNSRTAVKMQVARLTPISDTRPAEVKVDESGRLREIRALVIANNRSTLDTDTIICQIYMESRFDKNANAQGSSARGLMQLLRAPVRELARLNNLAKPRAMRRPESDLYREADAFHDSLDMLNEALNIQTGTAYLQALIDKRPTATAQVAIEEAYKDYRGIRNGIYYRRIKAAADKLSSHPDTMQILRDMVK
ncbi:Transglycosylase SLT domain-containing protein [Duganella sacchari]|uniref:Transglycosylase SLT domain-containing protein n=1 Tax=Duganella sacchari TaxID=551987 RepID=A0A1M7R1K8_9BURK|nr:transglycosylase SLT domain-containing protein [Duganella sacchari]SHN38512.1 Transglycosylase SLT domain-containing protein [Duganella sacchari]